MKEYEKNIQNFRKIDSAWILIEEVLSVEKTREFRELEERLFIALRDFAHDKKIPFVTNRKTKL